jgi:hypothetical protein
MMVVSEIIGKALCPELTPLLPEFAAAFGG